MAKRQDEHSLSKHGEDEGLSSQQSEERFRTLFELFPSSTVLSDLQGTIVLCNRRFVEMHRTAGGPEAQVGRNVAEFFPEDQWPLLRTMIERSIEGEHPEDPVEYLMLREDGSSFPVEAKSVVFRDAEGEPLGLLAQAQDITERKQAQEQLKILSAVVEQSANPVAVLTPAGVVEYVNARLLTSFGASRDEVVGKPWRGFVSSSSTLRDKLAEMRSCVLEQGQMWRGEVSDLDERGETIWRESTVFPIKDDGGAVTHIVYMSTDVTERKRAYEALQRSEEKHRLLAENVTDVIWTMDMDLHFTFISQSIVQLRGYSAEEALGHSLAQTMVPESLSEVMALFRRQLQLVESGDEAAWDPIRFEVEQPCKDGTTVFTRTNAKLVRGSDGAPGSIVGVTYDVTARKRAEAERASLQARLNQSQKMEAIGRLAGGVAHDFNNVLCAITGNAALALDDLPAGDPLRESIDEITKAAARAADLTRQLLAFSRKQVIEPRVIDLSDLLKDLHPMLVRLIGEDIILRTMPQQELGRARVDPGQVEQIVLNLAVNARDAMPDGGELLIETADVSLDDDYCQLHAEATPGAHVMLAVSDTGCGMGAELREKIFEPFFTTKQQGQGTGLGLATVFGIVEQNDGRIEVYSEPGTGSSFKIYFPRVADEVETFKRTDGPRPTGGEETVLVVEDEEMVRSLAERLLRRLGYKVLTASSAGDALVVAERHEGPIDLLLTDVVMPHMNGRELAERMDELRPGIRVLYTSGYTQNVIAHHGVLDEGVKFIAKPYSLDTLAGRVREVLDQAG